MKNASITRALTAAFLVGIAICTYLIVQNKENLQGESQASDVHLLNRLAAKLVTERLAEVHVASISVDPSTNTTRTHLEWRERLHVYGDGREEFGPAKLITVNGTRPRFEALVIEFDDTDAPESLALGSGNLILFRRIYDENTAPTDGFSFADSKHPVPDVYATTNVPDEAEQSMWRRFWHLATDPAAAEVEGIHVHQVARSIATTLSSGKDYRVVAEAGGRMRIEEITR